jgi:hypothetical protein
VNEQPKARARYTFGPLEQRGLVGSLRPTQTAILAAALVIILLVLVAAGRHPAGMLLAVAVGAVALVVTFWPMRGRTLEAWVPVALRFLGRRASGRVEYRSSAPSAGVVLRRDGTVVPATSLPEELGDVELLAARVDPPGPAAIGVVKDRRADTYTATLGVRVRNFALLSDAEQERRLAAYGTVLAGLARDDSPVRRVGWIERTVPNDGDDVAAYLQQARDPALSLSYGPVASYIELIESAADVTQDHELFVSLQLDGSRGRSQARRLGRGDEGMLRLVVRELDLFARRLEGAGVQVLGALPPRMLAKAIRDGYDPFGRTARARASALDSDRAGTPVELAGPQARKTGWATVASDSAVHATYWISEWPRIDIGAVFLQPLLMQTTAVRTVAMVMDAIPPSRAIAEVEHARTTDIADEATRQRLGQTTTARHAQKAQATARREQELADGHAELRYAAYVTVSASIDDEEALDQGCAEVEHAAQQSRLRLERLYGEQDYAFTFGLPLCRGLS